MSAQRCHVEISEVLAATIYRGPPNLAQILQNHPEHADRILAESHGDHHLACIYRVQLNGKAYRYQIEFPDTLRKLDEGYCAGSAAKKQAKRSILSLTRTCRDPEAQATWGHSLEKFP